MVFESNYFRHFLLARPLVLVVFSLIWFLIFSILPMRLSISIENASGHPDLAQVFWNTESENFTESKSHRFTIEVGFSSNSFFIDSAVEKLRLDPIRREGRGEIRRIYLTNIFLLPLANWDSFSEFSDWLPNGLVLSRESEFSFLKFESAGKDPMLLFSGTNFLIYRKLFFNLIYSIVLGLITEMTVLFLFRQKVLENRKQKMRRREVHFAILAILISTFFSLGTAEVMFRIFVTFNYDERVSKYRGIYEIITDNLAAYQFRHDMWNKAHTFGNPNSERNFTFHLNSMGLRGQELPKNELRKKVLVLGDSYAFGWAVNENETIPTQIQTAIDQISKSLRVINAGIPGYTILQELGVLQNLSNTLKPDIVALFFVMNDAEPVMEVPTPPDISYRLATFWIVSELKELINNFLLPSAPIFKRSKFVSNRNYLNDFRKGSPNWEITKNSIFALSQECKKKDIPFLIFIFPDFTQEFDTRYAYKSIHQQVRDWGSELSIPTYDLMEIFADSDSSLYRVPWDGHPNGVANKKSAAWITKILLETESLKKPSL